jgi:hypothetical protein
MAELRIAHTNQIKDKTGIPSRMNMKTDIAAGNIATNGGVSKETLNGQHGCVNPTRSGARHPLGGGRSTRYEPGDV